MATRSSPMGSSGIFSKLTARLQERGRHEARFWTAQAVVWGIYLLGLLLYLRPELLPSLPASVSVAPLIVIRLVFFVAASTVLRGFYRLPAIRRLSAAPTVAVIIAACGSMAIGEHFLLTPATAAVLPAMATHLHAAAVKLTVTVLAVLVIWSLGYMLLNGFVVMSRAEDLSRQARQRATDLELALRASELARLGGQVKPHFLFNALTAVVACRHDADAVAEVTNALAEYLRFCLATSDGHDPLGRELDAIEHLLAVHQARLQSGIECQVDSTPEARVVPVPPMLVGPLVENALKYGSQTSEDPLTIMINARIEDGNLRITVANSGAWVDHGSSGSNGTGLANLRRRLELANIIGASVTTTPGSGNVVADITLPVASCLAAADALKSPAAGTAGHAEGGARGRAVSTSIEADMTV